MSATVAVMRVEYSGTLLEQILELVKTRSVDAIYLGPKEYIDVLGGGAGQKDILESQSGGDWFTVEPCDIVFYSEKNIICV